MIIEFLIILTILITSVGIIFSVNDIMGGYWKQQLPLWVPSYAIIFTVWFWIFMYCMLEPRYKQESKITTIHETVKDDGANVQWFYNYDGNYQPLDRFYKNPEEYEVTVSEIIQQPRIGIYARFPRKIDYQVRKKEQ